jgi:hypothetical protein
MGDIGLWEPNEAFAVQVILCRDVLGIPQDRLHVNGGAIALGHPPCGGGDVRWGRTRGGGVDRGDVTGQPLGD